MKKYLAFVSFVSLLNVLMYAQPAIEWQKSYGGTMDDNLSLPVYHYSSHENIQPTSDGGYIFTGTTYSNDIDVTGHHGNTVEADCWLVKLDNLGNLDWQKSYGGRLQDCAYSVKQTSDGGYIVAGSSRSYDGDVTGHHGTDSIADAWILKVDASGSIQWNKCFGGSLIDEANSIEQTFDGGYIFSGYTGSNDGDVSGNHMGINFNEIDYWLVKLDANGNMEWQKCLGGTKWERSYCTRQTKDSGYIIVGSTQGSLDGDITFNNDNLFDNVWVVKLNPTGTIQWQKTWGGSNSDIGYDIQQTQDGGYIVGCTTLSVNGNVTGNHGNADGFSDYWIFKLNALGNMVWKKCYGGTYYDFFSSIRETIDGGYIMSGYSYSTDGDITFNHGKDSWLVKINSTGVIQWQKCFGGSKEDEAYGAMPTPDGGYIFISDSKSNNGDVSGHHGPLTTNDFWVVKLAPLIGIDEINNSNSSLNVFPNPAAESVKFTFDLDENNSVIANIYDITGKVIKKLIDEKLSKGFNEINWDLTTQNNQPVENGTYIVKINTGKITLSKIFNVIR